MLYVDFRKMVIDKLKERYGLKGWDIRLYLEGDTSKNKDELELIRQTNLKYFGHRNDTMDGDFIIMSKSSGTGKSICRFEVKYLFDEFKKNDWAEVFEITDSNAKTAEDTTIPTDSIENYDEINNMLIVRPLNYEKNKESLAGHVFRQIGDIAIVLYMKLFEDKDNLTSIKIPLKYLNNWGISKDQAIDRALENSSILYPAEIYCTKMNVIQDTILGIGFVPFDVNTEILDSNESLYCTSTKKMNGAAVLFYPGMKEKIYKALGNEDYYVAFLSTSEFHIHRCSELDSENVLNSLRGTNKTFTEEVLSNMVFRYYGDRNDFLPVDIK